MIRIKEEFEEIKKTKEENNFNNIQLINKLRNENKNLNDNLKKKENELKININKNKLLYGFNFITLMIIYKQANSYLIQFNNIFSFYQHLLVLFYLS